MKDKIKEIESLLHVNEMADESLSPDMHGKWCEVVVAIAKTRNLELPEK